MGKEGRPTSFGLQFVAGRWCLIQRVELPMQRATTVKLHYGTLEECMAKVTEITGQVYVLPLEVKP